MGIGYLFLVGEGESDHSSPLRDEVNNTWSLTSTPKLPDGVMLN